jgi:hypothetical protein
MRSRFRLKFVGDVDLDLRREMIRFARWIRENYLFEIPLEIRLYGLHELKDTDGTCWDILRWQSTLGRQPVYIEIAVGDYPTNVTSDGRDQALTWVADNIAHQLKHYFQMVNDAPTRCGHASRWADKLLDAFLSGAPTPKPMSYTSFMTIEEWDKFISSKGNSSYIVEPAPARVRKNRLTL